MPLISHRGAAGLATENSLKSIKLAESFHPSFIEIDVHRTRDGVFVIYHGAIKNSYSSESHPETYEKLKNRVPTVLTLDELQKASIKTPLIFDIKCSRDVDKLIKVLKTFKNISNCAFAGPHAPVLYEIKKNLPSNLFFISQPYHHGPILAIELARQHGFQGISLNKWWLSPLVKILTRHYKKRVMVYTINNSFWMWAAQKLYPSVYICTDFPDKYRRHFPV